MANAEIGPRTIVIVPGHAVLVNVAWAFIDAGWIADFLGEAVARMLHIWVAIKYAAEQMNAIVIFSGAPTKATDLSEAKSYLNAAKYYQWLTPGIKWLLDEYALDSMTNIVFSLARSYQEDGYFPSRVVVCGFEFKRRRYLLHWAALVGQCPILKDTEFIYIGASNPGIVPLLSNDPDMEARRPDFGALNASLALSAKKEQELVDEMVRVGDLGLTGRTGIAPSSPRYDFQAKRRERNRLHQLHPYENVPFLIGLERDGCYSGL